MSTKSMASNDNLYLKFCRFAGVLAAIALTGTIPAHADLITNGSFENASVNPGAFVDLPGGSTAITGWTVTLNHIDYVDALTWQAADGNRSLDLEGSFCNLNTSDCAGGIKQSFATVSGQQYVVTFDLAGNYANTPTIKTISVTAASQQQDFTFDTTGKSAQNMGWLAETWTFTANASTTTLEFQTADNPVTGWGPALDNVAVNPVQTQGAVPEVSSLLLLGTVAIALVGFRLRSWRAVSGLQKN